MDLGSTPHDAPHRQGDVSCVAANDPTLKLTMNSLRTFAIAAATVTLGLVGCAQTPIDHGAHHPDTAASAAGGAMPMGGPGASMARMDEHMKVMREMHEKMMRAKTPAERSALMAEHMKIMQEGMAMMGGMGPGGTMGRGGPGAMGGMGGTQGDGPMAGDMAMRHTMMEKRMEMMQSMMQMMMDRMPPAPAKQ